MDLRIRELLLAPEIRHDLNWLKSSLQTVITVEFSTIPLYLVAHWSIDATDGGDPDGTAETTKSIVLEEMLHIGLACNMLAAVGGEPVLNRPGFVPTYPGYLLGGVYPGIKVALRRLSPATLDTLMGIENPSYRPIGRELALNDPRHTIGEFYEAIERAFERLQPKILTEKQLAEPKTGLFKIVTLEDAMRAIRLILHQGEGFRHSPVSDPTANTLAHYYRFAELYHGARLKRDDVTGQWSFNGPLVRFPRVHPMADIPGGGYGREDVAPEVWADLLRFDIDYTAMLNHLQRAWETGDPTQMLAGEDAMRRLGSTAVRLMKTPIPGGSGCYGPCFRLLA
jgi:hypothetical protein